MDIALHLGAHLTDDSQMRSCLRANGDALADQGVLVPPPRRFLERLTAPEPASDTLERLRHAVEADDTTQRLVLSAPALLARKPEICDGLSLYPAAAGRLAALRAVLGEHETELFFCIRNPATYIPSLLHALKDSHRDRLLETLRSEELRWSPLIAAMRQQWPEAAVTVWCDEDTPFLWHQILEEVASCAPEDGFRDSYVWYDSIMVAGGAAKLEAYLAANPPVDAAHRQKVIAAFLDKFCDAEKLDIDVTITGWDETRIDVLSQLYEDDIEVIAAMDGVRLIRP